MNEEAAARRMITPSSTGTKRRLTVIPIVTMKIKSSYDITVLIYRCFLIFLFSEQHFSYYDHIKYYSHYELIIPFEWA